MVRVALIVGCPRAKLLVGDTKFQVTGHGLPRLVFLLNFSFTFLNSIRWAKDITRPGLQHAQFSLNFKPQPIDETEFCTEMVRLKIKKIKSVHMGKY